MTNDEKPIPEPDCTCYEYLGGHQPGCPMRGMSREAIQKWEQQYSEQQERIANAVLRRIDK